MKTIPFNPNLSFYDYLKDQKGVNEDIINTIKTIFDIPFENAYQEALFFHFLIYLFGDYQNLETIITRLDLIIKKEYIPENYEQISEILFGEFVENSIIRNIFDQEISPSIPELNDIIHNKSQQLIETISKSFTKFYQSIEDALYIDENEIHTEELKDAELEEEALRWEYKYLRKHPDKLEKIRNIYTKRHDQCLKSN